MTLDKEKFATCLRKIASLKAKRHCAKNIRIALEAGGAVTDGHPDVARLWGPTLLRIGFKPLTVLRPTTFSFKTGDIVVIQPYPEGNPAGHIAGYDGRQWISDFLQIDFWGGKGYRDEQPSHAFYRI